MFCYTVTVVVFNGKGVDLTPTPSMLLLLIVQAVKNLWIESRPGLQLRTDHGGQVYHSVRITGFIIVP